MRRSALLTLPLLTVALATGCASGPHEAAGPISSTSAPASPQASRAAAESAAKADGSGLSSVGFVGPGGAAPTTPGVSLEQAGRSQSAAEAFDRKIIRNAEIAIEVDDPAAAQQKI